MKSPLLPTRTSLLLFAFLCPLFLLAIPMKGLCLIIPMTRQISFREFLFCSARWWFQRTEGSLLPAQPSQVFWDQKMLGETRNKEAMEVKLVHKLRMMKHWPTLGLILPIVARRQEMAWLKN